jgi:hypothetical protein
MLKDLQIALRAVDGKGIDLPSTAATAGALMGAVQAGWGDDDFASLARHYSYAGSVKDLPEEQKLPVITSSKESKKEHKQAGKVVSKSKLKPFLGFFGGSKSPESSQP